MKKMMLVTFLMATILMVASNPVVANATQEVAEDLDIETEELQDIETLNDVEDLQDIETLELQYGGFTIVTKGKDGNQILIHVYYVDERLKAEVSDVNTYEPIVLTDVQTIRQTADGVRIVWGPEPYSPMLILGASIVEIIPE